MTLQEQFVDTFKESDVITTQDILIWYKAVKKGTTLYVSYSTPYNLIIYPLIAKGILVRVDKGLYKLSTNGEPSPEGKEITKEEEEWESYIKNKLAQELTSQSS